MTSIVIYDSMYGNTQKIAQTIARTLKTRALPVSEFSPQNLKSFDLIVFGSPTHGGRPSPNMQKFLNSIPKDGLKNIKYAAFDTHMTIFIAKLFGYASDKIVKTLKQKGGQLVSAPGYFIVDGKEGPLRQGELDRASLWAKSLK